MKTTTTNTTTTTRTTAEELYNQAEKAVYIALRARHEKSGLQFLADLQNAQTTDRKARNNATIAEQMTPHEKALEELIQERDELQKGLQFVTRQSVNLKNSEDIRREYAKLIKQHTAKLDHINNRIKHERDTIADLFKQLETTYTDRADLTQTAVLKILELEQEPAPIKSNVLAVYGVESVEELTEEEREQAQEQANFRAVINAVGKSINTLATPEALNSTKTKVQPITEEEVNEFIHIYGGIGNEYKAPHTAKRSRQSDCYITIEERHTKTQNGFYKVTHYKTIAPYQYIEDFSTTEDGENDIEYLKSYDPFVSTYNDIDYIVELATRCDLTDRQVQFLRAFASRCRFSADFKDCKKYAFSEIGITSDRTQRDFFAKLKKALATANK